MGRTLVVDGSCEDREALVWLLSHSGFDVAAASRWQRARRLLRRSPFSFVVLDVRLRDGWAYSFIDESVAAGARVAVVTAHGSRAGRRDAFARGAVAYFSKPVDPKRLVAALRGDVAFEDPAPFWEPTTFDEVAWEHAQELLCKWGWSVERAARALQMPRESLRRKLRVLHRKLSAPERPRRRVE